MTAFARFAVPVLAAFALAGCLPQRQAGAGERSCAGAQRSPSALVRMWIEDHAQVVPLCRLTASTYRPVEPPFGRYRLALARRLESLSQRNHRLYLVFLVNTERTGRYVLDLRRESDRRWSVDLWAEL